MKIRLGGEWRPLDAAQIERILPSPDVIPVPKAPEGVAGLLYYAGRAVPVLRPRADEGEQARFAVLLRQEDGTLGGVLAGEIAEDGEEGDGSDPV